VIALLRAGSDTGQALVEMAIALPVLLLLLIGVVDISLSVNAYITVTNASREGATYVVTHPGAAPSAVASAVTDRIAPLLPSNVSVTTTYYNSASATFTAWPDTGLASSSPLATSVPVRVDVSYPWSATTILIGQFFGGASRTFHGTSTMVVVW
jgi:Flp pilus assembly protein TadG